MIVMCVFRIGCIKNGCDFMPVVINTYRRLQCSHDSTVIILLLIATIVIVVVFVAAIVYFTHGKLRSNHNDKNDKNDKKTE